MAALLAAAGACGSTNGSPEESRQAREAGSTAPETIVLRSTAFAEGEAIPRRYTCEGADVPPRLSWSGVPRRARELALVVEDPDAPGGTFVHWILTGIRPGVDSLGPENTPPGARPERNDFGEAGYGGPCPPKGARPHRYTFTLYALGARTGSLDAASPEQAIAAIEGRALARGTLTGRFGRR